MAHQAAGDEGVGDGRARAAAAVAGGPGREPALSGPTLSTPSASTQAIEPPPSPMDVTETEGMKIWKSPIRSPTPYCGLPSTMIATSALVPPMSRLMQPLDAG